MTELAAQLVLSRERISRVVDEMAREGLVVREANPSDGRSWFATLTDEGRHELLMASPTYQAAVWRGFGASATAVHLRQLAEALEAMLNDSVGRE